MNDVSPARATRRHRLRVLALATYPVEAAASRYRIVQFIEPLAKRGLDVHFSPFLDGPAFAVLYDRRRIVQIVGRLLVRTLRRIGDVFRGARADVLWVQREAMLFGPPVVEWLINRVLGRPMVLDLDDATYISSISPVYGRLATVLKWPRKTDALIRWSAAVVTGSEAVAAHAAKTGVTTFTLPSIVDLQTFHPVVRRHEVPVIGWIGTHSTYSYLEPLIPVLTKLAAEHRFRLRIIGSGRDAVTAPGVDLDLRPWRLETEVEDFQSLDIGLYPLPDDDWSAGKSGLKAVQYMAVGVPAVSSPVGICQHLGIPGKTHLFARTPDEWYVHLAALLTDAVRRETMGREARRYAEEHLSLDARAERIAAILSAPAEKQSCPQ